MSLEFFRYYLENIPKEGPISPEEIAAGIEFWEEKLYRVHVMGIVGNVRRVWGHVLFVSWDLEREEFSATVRAEDTQRLFTYPARLLRVNAIHPKK